MAELTRTTQMKWWRAWRGIDKAASHDGEELAAVGGCSDRNGACG